MSQPASSRQLSPEKADAILAGAMQEFLAKGYAATSMDRVAAAAGVSKPTIYNHFKDKQGLFIGSIRHMQEQKFDSVYGPLRSPQLEGEPREVLTQLGLSLLETIRSDPQALSFVRLILAESERFPELAKAFVSGTPAHSLQLVGNYLRQHPELNLLDADVAARIFIGTIINFILFSEILYGKEVLPMAGERLVEGLVIMLTQGAIASD